MKTLKLLFAAAAAVTMTFTALAGNATWQLASGQAFRGDGQACLYQTYTDNDGADWYTVELDDVVSAFVNGTLDLSNPPRRTGYSGASGVKGPADVVDGVFAPQATTLGNMNYWYFSLVALVKVNGQDMLYVSDLNEEGGEGKYTTLLSYGLGNAEYDATGGYKGKGYYRLPAPTAKAVVENDGKTLKFVYDSQDYGTKGTNWFSVAEAEAIDPLHDEVPWCDCDATVTNVVFDSSFAAYRPKQCGSWFYYFGVLAAVDGLKNLNTSVTTSMAYMFCGCSSLTTLDVSGFDTANVTDMNSMFGGCWTLMTLDVSGFDTANVTDMGYMFVSCLSLEAICASGRFVTDQVSDSSYMFYGCSKLVGGAGTAYDKTKTDKAYARIDGKDGQPGYFTRGTVRDDLNGDGRADIVMTIDDPSHPSDGLTGAWLIQNDQTAAWGDLSQRNADWDILGLGATAPGKATKDVYLVSSENVVAWTTDDAGKVTGWKAIGSFDAATKVRGLGDFNGDGQSDLLLVNDNGAVGCYFTSGKKTGWNYFQSLGPEWQICGIGDLNGDGRDDLVLLHDAGFAGSWLTQADGTVEWANLDTLQPGFAIVGCGDFDGDGTDDVLLRTGNSYGAWLVRNGNASVWMGLGDLGDVTVEQIADFDGDGRDDLRIRTANGDLGAELVKGEDKLTWAYYGSVGAEWLTEPLGLK